MKVVQVKCPSCNSPIYEKQLDIGNPLTGQSYTDPNERSAQLASVGNIISRVTGWQAAHRVPKTTMNSHNYIK